MRLHLIPALTAAFLTIAAAPAAPTYSVASSIPGPDGSWDYARVDPSAHRLYVARGDAVTAVDLASDAVTSVGHVQRGHAVMPLADGRLLVTSGTDGTVRFLNAANGNQIASVAVGKKPDAAILDEKGDRAFIMNAESGTISVLDTASMRVTRTFRAKPGLEYAALAGNTLFVNNEDLNEIEVVDIARGKPGKAIALPGCEGPTGLGYDASHARLISACANGKAAIIDTRTHRLSPLLDIGRGADAVIIDEGRGLAFIPCGRDGVLDILSLASSSQVTAAGRVTTEIGARTGALDPSTGTIFLPTAQFTAPALPGGRPTPVPGSFHILVVKPD